MDANVEKCLGIIFERDLKENCVRIHDSPMIDATLKTFNTEDCSPSKTPMQEGLKLMKAKPSPEDGNIDVPYRELVGIVMYL